MISSYEYRDSHGTAQVAHNRKPDILQIACLTTTLLGL